MDDEEFNINEIKNKIVELTKIRLESYVIFILLLLLITFAISLIKLNVAYNDMVTEYNILLDSCICGIIR